MCSNYDLGLFSPKSDNFNILDSYDTQVSEPGSSWPSCYQIYITFEDICRYIIGSDPDQMPRIAASDLDLNYSHVPFV